MIRKSTIIILAILLTAVFICSLFARRSEKPIGKSVSNLLLTIIPAAGGQLLVMLATTENMAYAGYYLFCVGMDVLVVFLFHFIIDYCFMLWKRKWRRVAVYCIFSFNIIQILLNHVFGHAFKIKRIDVNGSPYFKLVQLWGYKLHTVIIIIFAAAVFYILLRKLLQSSSMYYERYTVIFLSMLVSAIWEIYYVLSGKPVDRSMIAFCISGILIFYFSIVYKPVHLLTMMFGSIAAELPEALFFFDEGDACIWANEKGMKLAGVSDRELGRVKHRLKLKFPEIVGKDQDWCVLQVTGSGNDRHYYQVENHLAFDDKDRYIGYFISVNDNTAGQRKLESERYNARHDRLTGLFNKEYLYSRIRTAIDEKPGQHYLVAYVDVNEFKLVNDVFGRDFGDFVLKEIADWIALDMPNDCIFGRIGGDTFGVFQPVHEFDPERINRSLANFVVRKDNKEHRIQMQIGVYEIEDNKLDVSLMFDRARMALSTIKRLYSNIAYYDDTMREDLVWNQKITGQLEKAISERQLVPYLQPIVDTSGKPVGCEALVRWNHPEKGFLPPSEFVPVLERNGKIVELDKYMWRRSCELLKEWETAHPDLFVSVNISPIDFYFVDVKQEIRSLVREFGIDPSKLRIEITEAVMMTNMEERVTIINQLRADGHILEMDDFGSGYSSLNMLKDLPADVIKIDMMFLRNAKENAKAKTILDNIINMINELGMVPLTEGVETEIQYRTLLEEGCRLFQGYYFAKPMPVEEFERYLRPGTDR